VARQADVNYCFHFILLVVILARASCGILEFISFPVSVTACNREQ
jgi:hypothetical protein